MYRYKSDETGKQQTEKGDPRAEQEGTERDHNDDVADNGDGQLKQEIGSQRVFLEKGNAYKQKGQKQVDYPTQQTAPLFFSRGDNEIAILKYDHNYQ